jgi:hypothetical protein
MGQLDELMERFVSSMERIADATEKRSTAFERQVVLNEKDAARRCAHAGTEEAREEVTASEVIAAVATGAEVNQNIADVGVPVATGSDVAPAVGAAMAAAEVAVPTPVAAPVAEVPNAAEAAADRSCLLARCQEYGIEVPKGTKTPTLVKKIAEYEKIAATVAPPPPVHPTAPPVATAVPTAVAPPVAASAPVAVVPTAAAPPVAAVPVAAPVAASAPPAAAPPAATIVTGEKVTAISLSTAITALYQAKDAVLQGSGATTVKAVLASFGAESLGSIPETKYDEVYAAVLKETQA